MDKKIKVANDLWWVTAIVPLVIIISSFLMGGWYWGLMDDLGMVSMHGSVLERLSVIFNGLFSVGRFVPFGALHMAVFYKLFTNSPTAFYIFRWFEVTLTLALWGIFVNEITGKKWSAWLFITVTLGFYKFYNGFFYLSIFELTGVMFTAPAAIFFARAVGPALKDGKKVNWSSAALCLLFLILAVGTKETFFVAAAAFGMGLVLFSIGRKDRGSLLFLGIGFLILSLAYVLMVKFLLIRGYSADYKMNDMDKLSGNFQTWVHNVLLWHSPWIFVSVLSAVLVRKVKRGPSFYFFMVVSVLLYLGYLLAILPWYTWGHYCLPLGVFFGVIVSLGLADLLEMINPAVWWVIFLAVLCFNIFVSSAALQEFRSYEMDSKNLATWIAQNLIFSHDLDNGAVVRINAMEPATAIPEMTNRIYGKNFKSFIFTGAVGQILADPKTRYYLWGVTWGDQDLRRLGPYWTPVFVSSNWVMFRRMY